MLKFEKKNTERDSYLFDIHKFKKFFTPEFQRHLTFNQFKDWSRQLGKMFRVIKASTTIKDNTRNLPLYMKDLGIPEGEDSLYKNRERYAEINGKHKERKR